MSNVVKSKQIKCLLTIVLNLLYLIKKILFSVRHNCHSDEKCPPCTELTKKACMGSHEV